MTLDDLVPPDITSAVATHGLHKIAGAMLGVPELTLKEALVSLGTKAYLRRKEARAVADGVAALAALTGVKVAENPALSALLRRSVMPALAGAGIAAAPQLLDNNPMNQGGALPAAGIGALLGAAGGMAHGIGTLPPQLGQEIAAALR